MHVCHMHVRLRGRGSRSVARQSLGRLSRALAQGSCKDVMCVVHMGDSTGASLLSLPVVANFLLANSGRIARVAVVEAHGLALVAARTVIRLSGSQDIQLYESWSDFERRCAASRDPRDREALLVEQGEMQSEARTGRRRPQEHMPRWAQKLLQRGGGGSEEEREL